MANPSLHLYDIVLNELLRCGNNARSKSFLEKILQKKEPEYFFDPSSKFFIDDIITDLLVDNYIEESLFCGRDKQYTINRRGRGLLDKGGYEQEKRIENIPFATTNFNNYLKKESVVNPYHLTGFETALVNAGMTPPPNSIPQTTRVVERVEDERISGSIMMTIPATNPKKSRARTTLDFFAHPDTKTVLQTMVWMITIFGAVLAIVKWVIPWVKSF